MSTLETFLSMMAQGFVQRAFVIGVIVAFLSSLLSVFIVLRKVSLIGDGLAHTAFGGLALGYYLDLVPLWVAGGVVVLGSIGITRAMRSSKISGDAAVAIFPPARPCIRYRPLEFGTWFRCEFGKSSFWEHSLSFG